MKTDSSLHRAGKRPDWSKVSRRRWNIWQRVAGNSGGVLTVGNVFTLIGFCLVLAGLMMVAADMNWSGLVLIAVGRICDLLDGWLAERTKTKSPLGEMLDTTADKLETAAALVVLTVFGVLPWPAALLVFVPQLSVGLWALAGWLRGKQPHPSRLGKLGMAAVWLGLGLFIAQAASGVDAFAVAGYASCAISTVLTLLALRGYVQHH